MADITERPGERESEGVTATPGPSASGGPSQVPVEALPGMPEDAVYRPLSLLAIIGFALSLLFAAGMAITAFVALYTRSPLLPPLILFAIPAAAVAVALLARYQIRQSEGTLSGEKLTNWALGLSIVICVLHGAYFSATYLAVTQQASDYADTWLTALKSGDPARSYWYFLTPENRRKIQPTDPGLRKRLELAYRDPSGNMPFGEFRRGEVMAVFGHAGDSATWKRTGVSMPQWEKGGYRVTVRYRVQTAEASGDLEVHLFGRESSAGDEGRQWIVYGKETRFTAIQFTELGERHRKDSEVARRLAKAWHPEVETPPNQMKPGEQILHRQINNNLMYAATIPELEREKGTRALAQALSAWFPALSGGASLAAISDASRTLLFNRRLYDQAVFLEVDEKEFWAPDEKRDDILQRARQMFTIGSNRRFGHLTVPETTIPVWEEKDGHTFMSFPASLILFNDTSPTPLYELEAQLILEGVQNPARPETRVWHIHRLKLLSGHTAAQGPPGSPG